MPLVAELALVNLNTDDSLLEISSHDDVSKKVFHGQPYRQYSSESTLCDTNNNPYGRDHLDEITDLKRGSSAPIKQSNPFTEFVSINSPETHPFKMDLPNHGPDNEVLFPLGLTPVNSIRRDVNNFEFDMDGSQGDLPSHRELFVVSISNEFEGSQNEREKMKRLQRCGPNKWFVDERVEWACPQFRNRSTRSPFIRKVFGLVLLQFLLAILWTTACVNILDLNIFVKNNLWIMYLCGVICVGFYLAIGCTNIGKSYPLNVGVLVIFALVVSYICGAATVRYSTITIILALSYITGICCFLMILTFFSKIDVTAWGAGIMILGGAGMSYGGVVVFCSFLIEEDETLGILQITAAAIGGFLISLYLLYDLQMLLGGRRSQLSEEDWLYAAMSLFYDIVMMFTYLLKMVRVFNNR